MGEELAAVYVRLSTEQADRLDRAAANLPARKKDLIAGLVDQFVDPDSARGLEALRRIASVGRGELVSGIEATGGPAASAVGRDEIGGPATGVAAREAAPRRPDHASRADVDAPILTPAGAAALLAVREADVLELAEHGELPGRRVAGHWRFSRDVLIDWVARPV